MLTRLWRMRSLSVTLMALEGNRGGISPVMIVSVSCKCIVPCSGRVASCVASCTTFCTASCARKVRRHWPYVEMRWPYFLPMLTLVIETYKVDSIFTQTISLLSHLLGLGLGLGLGRRLGLRFDFISTDTSSFAASIVSVSFAVGDSGVNRCEVKGRGG